MMMNVLDKAKYQPPDIMKPSKMTTSYEYQPDNPHDVKPLPKLPKTPIHRPMTPTTPERFTTPKIDKDGANRDKSPDGGVKRRLTVNIGRKVVDIDTVSEREMELIKRAEDLQADLVLALGATEDISALREKLRDVVDKLAQEKIWRADLVAENKRLENKQTMLLDHIEKLSFQLKHMAIARMKEKEDAMKVREENKLLIKKNKKQKRWAKSAKKCMEEFKGNIKLLNGQLTVMDENYVRIRLALDAAKDFQRKQVNDSVQECHELRVKYASISGKMLDEVYLPPDSPYIDKVRKMDQQRIRNEERKVHHTTMEKSQSMESSSFPPRPSTAGPVCSSDSNRRSLKDESVHSNKSHNGDRPSTAGHRHVKTTIEGARKHPQKLDRILNKISNRKTDSTHNAAEIWSTDRLNTLLSKSGLHHDPPVHKTM